MAPRKPSYRSPQTEATIDRILGTRDGKARWTYDGGFPVADIARRPEAQSRTTPTDMRRVRLIQQKCKETGAPMDPVIVWQTEDNGPVLVDGNHRTLAYHELKWPTMPAYVVTVDDEREALLLSAAFNAQHGQPLTPSEIRRAVVQAKALGMEDKAIVALFGFSASAVRNISQEQRAENRADALGLSLDGLTKSHVRALDAFALDSSFRDAAALAAQAAMSVADLNSLAKDVRLLASESAQHERIEAERQARTDDIAAVRVGRRAQQAPFSDLRQIVGTLARLREQYPNAREWVARDAATIEAWHEQVRDAAAFLVRVADEYEARQPMNMAVAS